LIQSRYLNWLYKIAFLFAASAFGLLGTQCGTFEVNSQFVTSTPTGSTATFQPSALPNTPAPSATATSTLRVIDNAQPTTGATVGVNSNQLGVPQLSDSQIIVDINSRLIYRSKTALNAALLFYKGEMVANGWTLVSDEHDETHALLTFSKGTEIVTVEFKTDWLGLLLDIKR
jgi:hypothetical protein